MIKQRPEHDVKRFIFIAEKGGKTLKKLKELVNEIKFEPKVELVETEGKVKLYLYGSIVEKIPTDWWTGEEIEGDYITMESVKEAFNKIKGDEVEIHLNSKGGDVYTSVAIGNFIKDSSKKVTVVIDAIAASGASIIAMAGSSIKMYPNSMMMIHRASAGYYGNAEEFRKVADNLEKFDEVVQASYLEHFKGTKEELKALIWNETYMTAEECVILGLADELIGKEQIQKNPEDNNATKVKNSLLEKYKGKKKKNILNKFKGD